MVNTSAQAPKYGVCPKRIRGVYAIWIHPLKDNEEKALWVSEPGLYKFIFSSKMKEAKTCTRWVVEEVLPNIRKTGKYETKQIVKPPQFQVLNETQLRYKVVDFIRIYYPDAILIAGFGEQQTTTQKRSDAF